ncbi:MAG: 4'-phosphopantetheinyl transferase superfamily protein [Microbacteriaceae bacterium]
MLRANPGVVVSWSVVNWVTAMGGAGEPTAAEIAALFGKAAEHWHAVHAIDRSRAARLLAGRRVVRDLVTGGQPVRWAGFEPTPPMRKPALADSDLDFSIAHSGKWLLAAIVAAGQVGVDIEVHNTEFDHPGLIRRMCTVTELETARSLYGRPRRAWLARLWTAKEAVAKLTGHGLRQDFRLLELGQHVRVDDATGPIAASIATRATADTTQLTVRQPDIRQQQAVGVAR